MQYQLELAAAERAALAAGEVIAAHYAKGEIVVDTKSDQSRVTQADRDANAVIVELLRAAFPSDTRSSAKSCPTISRVSASAACGS